MNVLSLFDGMSCGQLALKKAGIKVDNYFASEIDKFAIEVTQSNFPGTIQLGDVSGIQAKDLPQIDLIIGGSPCQGFSLAGKGLNFEDERSRLFFEFVRLKQELAPKYFLLENVRMKHEYEIVISKYMNVEPIEINSTLLTAQSRSRLYWTNINEKPYGLFGDKRPEIPQPSDKKIILSDILEDEVDPKYEILGKWKAYLERDGRKQLGASRIKIGGEKSICLTARQYANWRGNFLLIDKEGRVKPNQLKAGCLTAGGNSARNHSDMDLILQGERIRRYTPVECERLQSVPDNYTSSVSDSQRYKMLGNGWTVDVITHILSFANFGG